MPSKADKKGDGDAKMDDAALKVRLMAGRHAPVGRRWLSSHAMKAIELAAIMQCCRRSDAC